MKGTMENFSQGAKRNFSSSSFSNNRLASWRNKENPLFFKTVNNINNPDSLWREISCNNVSVSAY